jgi:large subunit ribosomal protein L17
MRHLVAHRKLGRTSSHRKSLLRNLCTSFVLNERLVTTLPKAKELRPFVERAITLGRRAYSARQAGSEESALHATRQLALYFFSGNAGPDSKQHHTKNNERTAGVAAVKKVTDNLAERFVDRPGGYTRIYKLGPRKGDGAEMALIEFVGSEAKKRDKAKAKDKDKDKDKTKAKAEKPKKK